MIRSSDQKDFFSKEKFFDSFSIRYLINSSHHLNLSWYRFIYYSSFNIFSQSDTSMLRLIVSFDWSDEWCRSDEVVSEILRVFVETASWWNRLLTFLQSNINSHWFDLSEFLSRSVSMNINMFQLNIKLQHFFFQHAKNLTIVAANVKFFHWIESNWFEKSSSSDCLLRDSTQD
jgi:hypothetical protein